MREKESFYLQKNVLACDIGINKMYVGSVTWVFYYGSSNLGKPKKNQKQEQL